jgi:hypothetical protein
LGQRVKGGSQIHFIAIDTPDELLHG